MSQTIRPFLMFQGQDAEAAKTFRVSLRPDGEILDIARYGALTAQPSLTRPT